MDDIDDLLCPVCGEDIEFCTCGDELAFEDDEMLEDMLDEQEP